MVDAIRRMLEEQERMRRLLAPVGDLQRLQQLVNPLQAQVKNLGLNSASLAFIREEEQRLRLLSSFPNLSTVTSELERIEHQRHLISGSVAEMHRLGLLDSKIGSQSAVDKIIQEQNRYNHLFRLPEPIELSALSHIAMTSSLTKMVMGTERRLEVCLASMQSPWLQIEDASASALGLSELVSIGRGIDIYAAYDESFSGALRSELGDWRDITMPTPQALINPISRSEFYVEQGLNTNLTDFTQPAFYDGLRVARLRSERDEADDAADGLDEIDRAKEAFELLLRFEVALRRFIEEVMEKEFGLSWMRQQLPNNMLATWVEKKEKAKNAGQSDAPLIDYADFSDYKPIIERRDNWERVFKHFFGRQQDVGESFNRLFPIRIATMHARIITNDDQLYLLIETKRIIKAMDRNKQP